MSFTKIAENASDEFLTWIVDEFPETRSMVPPDFVYELVRRDLVDPIKKIVASGFDINAKTSSDASLVSKAYDRNGDTVRFFLTLPECDLNTGKESCSKFLSRLHSDVR